MSKKSIFQNVITYLTQHTFDRKIKKITGHQCSEDSFKFHES